MRRKVERNKAIARESQLYIMDQSCTAVSNGIGVRDQERHELARPKYKTRQSIDEAFSSACEVEFGESKMTHKGYRCRRSSQYKWEGING